MAQWYFNLVVITWNTLYISRMDIDNSWIHYNKLGYLEKGYLKNSWKWCRLEEQKNGKSYNVIDNPFLYVVINWYSRFYAFINTCLCSFNDPTCFFLIFLLLLSRIKLVLISLHIMPTKCDEMCLFVLICKIVLVKSKWWMLTLCG